MLYEESALCHGAVVEEDSAAGGALNASSEDVEERSLSASGGAKDSHHLSASDFQVHVLEELRRDRRVEELKFVRFYSPDRCERVIPHLPWCTKSQW